MTDIDLPDFPLQSYEAAVPYLRQPYQPKQVWAKIQSTPKNENAPCTIALYSIGETMMDRFNLICGRDWNHQFEVLVEEKVVGTKTLWYCKVGATITALGKTEADIGYGWGPSQAAAEMNARAQAGKRAGRWHGPGQCLYASDEILMWRGEEGKDHLRIPKSGNDRYDNPYFDQEGIGQRYCRDRYERWLKRDGEEIYGEPLDHLAIARAIQKRPTVLAVSIPRAVTSEPGVLVDAVNGNGSAKTDHKTTTPAARSNGARPAEAPPAAKQYPPMPDHPAPEAVLLAAEKAGFGEPVARLLGNLAQAEGQDSKFTAAQLQAVTNWIAVLGELDVPEDVIVKAITVNAAKNTTQERRQARFAKWLSEKAAGEAPPTGEAPETAADAPDAPKDTEAATDAGPLDPARALAELRKARDDHKYTDRTVTRLAALATGVGPNARVDWPKVTPATLLVLADLLQRAGSLGWKNEQLDKETLKYHNTNSQTSSAGRFAAFANYLTDLAETRAMTTQADTIGVA